MGLFSLMKRLVGSNRDYAREALRAKRQSRGGKSKASTHNYGRRARRLVK